MAGRIRKDKAILLVETIVQSSALSGSQQNTKKMFHLFVDDDEMYSWLNSKRNPNKSLDQYFSTTHEKFTMEQLKNKKLSFFMEMELNLFNIIQELIKEL